jgi:hypothetical protein
VQYSLLHAKELNVEEERCVGWNFWRIAHGPVTKIAGHRQLAFTSNFHRQQSFVPGFNQPSDTNPKLGWRLAIGTVERSSIFERAGIVDHDRLSRFRAWPIADLYIDILQSRSSNDFRARRICLPRDDVDNGASSDQKDESDRAKPKVLITLILRLRLRVCRCVWIAWPLASALNFSMTTLWHGASYTDIIAAVQVRPN